MTLVPAPGDAAGHSSPAMTFDSSRCDYGGGAQKPVHGLGAFPQRGHWFDSSRPHYGRLRSQSALAFRAHRAPHTGEGVYRVGCPGSCGWADGMSASMTQTARAPHGAGHIAEVGE
jgi:hypothetical protein